MPTYSSEWDKGDYRANNEQRGRMGFGGTEFGGQQYAQRSRMLGDEAQKRGAYQSDFGQSNEARGLGMGARAGQQRATDLIESAARGNQPSAAEILARRNTTAAVRAGQSMAGGVKGGPGARVAAMRNAQRMGATMQAEGAARAEQMRADEMDRARGQFVGATTAMRQGDAATRGQDLDAQRIQQANELTQRGLNDAQQRFFEQQGYNTQVQDQNNQLAQQGMAAGMWSAGRQAEGEDEKFEFGKVMELAKGAAGAASGLAGGAAGAMSDEASKAPVTFGSLAPLSYGGNTGGGAAAMSGGGMNTKLGTQWNNSELRGMSGPGIMRSDMTSKSEVMFSPGEIKDRVNAPAFIAAEGERRGDTDPYMRVADTGVAGAPRGYAAARAGHAGSMFSDAPEATSGYEKQGATAAGSAPGTDDWNRYGAPAPKDGPVDWKHGGTTTKHGNSSVVLGSLSGLLGGFARSDERTKMYSDDKTKLSAAFEAGKAAADKKPEIGGKVKDAVKSATGEDAKKVRDAAIVAGGGIAPSPAAAPMALATGPAADALVSTTDATKEQARAAFAPPPSTMDYVGPALAGPIGGALLTRYTRSDEKAKDKVSASGEEHGGRHPKFVEHDDAIDLEGSAMRDGASDARTNSFDKSFRRDTKADQKRVKKGVEDKAGKDADAMMAGMRASLGQGPTARTEDIDNDAPDLSAAAKAREGQIPDHAMYSAMKAMKPSLYAYKPAFTPPEQRTGEVQAGPMANPMEKDPIAGLTIKKEPQTGLLAIDKDKALKLTMGSLAVLAQDVESLKRKKKEARQ